MDLTPKYTKETEGGISSRAAIFLPPTFTVVKREHEALFFKLLDSVMPEDLNDGDTSYAMAIPNSLGDDTYYMVVLGEYTIDEQGARVDLLSVSEIDLELFLSFVKLKKHLVMKK